MVNKPSETFCVHPWINLMVSPLGTYSFCCVATQGALSQITDDNNKLVHASKNTPDEAWNAKSMRTVRKAMLDGEKLDACGVCWKQEEMGKESYRERHNKEWFKRLGQLEVERRVAYSLANEYAVDTPPDYLDLRLGNLCNLKCRMCNLFNSSQIEKEHLKLRQNNMYADIWTRLYPHTDINGAPYDMNWVNYEGFWKNINEYVPSLKKVYFTGGEPTLLETPYTFMDEMVSQGINDKVDIMFNTNCTNVQPKWLNQLSKFRRVQINGSIDGIGAMNDYIRAPSKWKNIRENFIKIAKLPNVHIGISPVIQIYNILDVDKILEFAEEVSHIIGKVVDVDFLLCFHPTYLDPSNLPDRVRDKAFIKLQRIQDSWIYKQSEKNGNSIKNSVDSYLTMLEHKRHPDWKKNMKDFWNMTEIYDKSRNQSFKKSIPELYGLLSD
jgi:pyruvate-formate lyase-activating enzyme